MSLNKFAKCNLQMHCSKTHLKPRMKIAHVSLESFFPVVVETVWCEFEFVRCSRVPRGVYVKTVKVLDISTANQQLSLRRKYKSNYAIVPLFKFFQPVDAKSIVSLQKSWFLPTTRSQTLRIWIVCIGKLINEIIMISVVQ